VGLAVATLIVLGSTRSDEGNEANAVLLTQAVLAHSTHLRSHLIAWGSGGHPAGAPRRRGGSGGVAAVRVKGASMNRAAFVVLFALPRRQPTENHRAKDVVVFQPQRE